MASIDIEDETGMAKLTATIDVYTNQIDGWQQENEDAVRLQEQYEFNIRQVNNDLRITLAKIQAELVNAQLMVAIKNQMNFKQDLSDIEEKTKGFQALIDAGDANSAALQE